MKSNAPKNNCQPRFYPKNDSGYLAFQKIVQKVNLLIFSADYQSVALNMISQLKNQK